MMKRSTDETALLIRYLLGDVSEDEQLRLEEEFFTDDASYQQLTALEDELRYDYAQGGLSPRERELFEKRFLATPADRQKIVLAKAVLEKTWEAARLSAGVAEPAQSRWQAFKQFFATPVTLVSAAAGVSALGAILFFSQTVSLRNELSRVQNSGQEAQVALNQQKSADEALRRELQDERSKREQLEREAPAQRAAVRPFLAFALAPGLLRDTDGPKRLRIPAETDSVRLHLDLKTADSATELRASLQNLDGQELWSQNVRAMASGVDLALPGRILPPGDYLVELKQLATQPDSGRPNEYYFTVVR